MKTTLQTTALAAALTAWAGMAQAEGVLNLYNWAEYTSPELIEKFEAETGIDVVIDTYDSSETLVAKLQAGGASYDIAVPGNNFVAGMVESGLLERVNPSQLEGFANLQEQWKSPPWDPDNEYSIPFLWGTTGFTVDTETYRGDIDTFAVLFEPPPELQGEIGMFNSADEVVKMAHVYLGQDICSEDPADFQRVYDLLSEQKEHVKMYQSEGLRERMYSGEVAIHSNWNGSSLKMRARDPRFAYSYPVEGVLTWMDVVVVPKGAQNIEGALQFMNFLLQPENIAIQTNFARYSNAIDGSDAFMDAELKTAPEIVAPSDRQFIFVTACSEASIRLQDQVWTRLLQ